MNEVKLFDFENNKMRTQEIDNQIVFLSKRCMQYFRIIKQ